MADEVRVTNGMLICQLRNESIKNLSLSRPASTNSTAAKTRASAEERNEPSYIVFLKALISRWSLQRRARLQPSQPFGQRTQVDVLKSHRVSPHLHVQDLASKIRNIPSQSPLLSFTSPLTPKLPPSTHHPRPLRKM